MLQFRVGSPPPLLNKKHTPKQIGQTFLGEHRGGC
jgi:hypothetical protein